MGTERPIHLDLGMPGAGAFGLSSGTGEQPPSGGTRDGEQLQGDARRLRELVDASRQAPLVPPAPAAHGSAGGAFGLFGAPAVGASLQPVPAAAAVHAPMPADLNEHLAGMAQRLLVSDGSSGRRAVQIQLDSEQLPGTVLDICEDGGQLLATFTCSVEATRERLAGNAQWLADGLAERLARATCVRVQTDDPEDPCLVQASAGT